MLGVNPRTIRAYHDDAAQGAQDEGHWKMTFQKKEEPLPIRGRRHHPERSSTLMRFPMRSDGYIHGYPHGHVHGHPHGDAHQIEGKQARRFMYMNRTQHLQRPSAQEQQPECRGKSRKAGVASDVIVATITRPAMRTALLGRPRPHGRLRLQTARAACATTVFHLCARGVTLVSTLLWRCCFGDLRAAARA